MKNHLNQKIKKSYNKIADIWNKEREWYIEQPSIDEAIKYLKPGASILDIGCGSGKPIAEYLLQRDFDVYGLDFSENLIKYATQIIPKEKLFLADICDFTIDIKFDAIICWFTLFHIHADNHLDVLKKFHSLLKPDGILLITFADTSCEPGVTNITVIDDYTIESEMFGEKFCHSGHPAKINSKLIKEASFDILVDKIDQPGNQLILAKYKINEVADKDVINHVIKQEIRLLDKTESLENLAFLVDDEFIEIGSSSKLYNKTDVIDWLKSDDKSIRSGTNFSGTIISEDVILLTYISNIKDNINAPTKIAMRSSIWRRHLEGNWKMIFHQGTPMVE